MSSIAQATTAASSQEVGHKVFVGNLTFGTTEDGLREIFAGQDIDDAQIIKKYKRGNRSLGYGFVTFAKEDQALAAIKAFDKKEINGRVINVEMAKPPQQKSIAQEAAQAAGGPESTAEHETVSAPRGRGRRGRGGRGGRGRGQGRRSIPADGEAETARIDDVPEETQVNGDAPVQSEGPRSTHGRGRGRGLGGRELGKRGPPAGEASQTLLFVANLPFSLDDAGLKNLFEGCNVASAHVVVRKFGPVAGRSKGFGFVDAADHAEQQKILEQFNNKEVEGRQIQIKVAIDAPERNEESTSADVAQQAVAAAGTN